MSSSNKPTNSSGETQKIDTVQWYLIDTDTGEVISERNDITDLLDILEHIDADTRLTDTPPKHYDED